MIYASSIQVEGTSHSVASLAGPSVGKEQETALLAYLGRSEEVRALYKSTIANGKAVIFVPGNGLFVKSITYGVGGTRHYDKIADWVPEKSTGEATSFEARRVGGEATSFEANLAPRTATISGEVAAAAQKVVTITGLVKGEESTVALRGIRNNGENSCFLNAALQFVIHSSLPQVYLDSKLVKNLLDKEAAKQIESFAKFHHDYLEGDSRLHSNDVQKAFNFNMGEEADAADFFRALSSHYDMKQLLPIQTRRSSKTDENRFVETQDEDLLLPLFISGEETTLQELLSGYFAKTSQEDSIVIDGDKEIGFYEQKILEGTPKDLFFSVVWADSYNDEWKKETQLKVISENVVIEEQNYSLHSFVAHSGEINGGHYIYYTKVDNKFYEINDESVSEIKREEFLKNAGEAYLVHLTAVE
ncbi:MAG: hypothetical protein ChlgKO_06810 [Chlamydiales bacterium]